MDRMPATSEEETEGHAELPTTRPSQKSKESAQYTRDWGQHPINLRVSFPLPFGRWYATLVAGRERRGKERLIEERQKHPLETTPNLVFLFSMGMIGAIFLLLISALTLIHGFGWSIQLTIPT